jgi:hypothetical protein
MNVAKNMEIIAVAAAILVSASCYIAPAAPALQVASATVTQAAPAGKAAMHVVQVKAKRLSAAEKPASHKTVNCACRFAAPAALVRRQRRQLFSRATRRCAVAPDGRPDIKTRYRGCTT